MGARGLLIVVYIHGRMVLGMAVRVVRNLEDHLIRLVNVHEIAGVGAFLYAAARKAASSLGLEFAMHQDGEGEVRGNVVALEPDRIDTVPTIPYVPMKKEAVVGNGSARIFWNYVFPTTTQITANKPDIVLLDIANRTMFVIEFSSLAEKNIVLKEQEKGTKYRELISELKQLYPGDSIKLGVIGEARDMGRCLFSRSLCHTPYSPSSDCFLLQPLVPEETWLRPYA